MRGSRLTIDREGRGSRFAPEGTAYWSRRGRTHRDDHPGCRTARPRSRSARTGRGTGGFATSGNSRDQAMRRPWTGRPAVGRPRARGARQSVARRNRRRQGGRRRLQRAATAKVQGRLTALSGSLAGKVLVMSGGSRGIGLAIAHRAARDGAKVAIIAKTEQPHPKLEGTIYTAAAEMRAAGGEALPIAGDVRDEE